MDRRSLLKALGMTAAGAIPFGRSGWALADEAPAAARNKRLVVVMLRGAVDGLSLVVPYGEPEYYQLRSSIALDKPGSGDSGLIDLDGHFGLHPALAPLQPLWQARKLAFIHASGSPDPTRSHFDAQDYMESGTPGVKSTQNGWMNRLLGDLPQSGELDAVSLGPVLPRIFSGDNRVANIPLGRAAANATAMDKPEINSAFDRMYADAGALGQTYQEGRRSRSEVLADLNSADAQEMMKADNGAPPPQGFSQDTRQLAALMQHSPQLRLAFMQLGGWDTHVNQGNAKGQLAGHLQPLAQGLAQLAEGLGPQWDDTVVVVMSEFGRTAHENGNRGTDHGHGNLMWVLGGPVAGGKVYGDWPGLGAGALHEGRDLAVTTDFRTVLSRVCEQHLRLPDNRLAAVFPQSPGTGGRNVKGLLTA